MKRILTTFTVLTLAACSHQEPSATEAQPTDYVAYVNPLMGTDSTFELSNGNTYPAIAVPWGMNFFTPQTGKMGDG